MSTLRSYVSGRWQTPEGEGRPLHDAVTGEEVARISSAGIDMAAALDHGRTVGGPALRALTFHQRAALLKSLASYLREHRDELYALSTRTGATLGDSKFDVDGGIGVLAAYASKGTRELPNAPSMSRATSSRWAGAGPSSASTSPRRCTAWRSRSTRSTSRCGGRWRSSRPPSWPAYQAWSSRPARPPTSPRASSS